MIQRTIAKLRAENAALKAENATLNFAYEAMRDGKLVEMTGRSKQEVMAVFGVRPSREDDVCPFCAAAEPTDLDRLFDVVNACLDGCQLDPHEPFDEMMIFGKLNLRKLLALIELCALKDHRDG